MRKIYILLFLAALISIGSHAQTTKKNRPNWGIKTGLNASKLNAATSTMWDEDWKTGFVFGAFFNIKAGSKFSIQPEFLYSSMGGNLSSPLYSEKHRLNYFSIPVLAKFNIGKGFSVVAGPQIDMLISAKTGNSNGATIKSTNNFNEESFNLTGGFEFFPGKCLGLSARYIHGLSNIWEPDGTSNLSKFRNQGVQLTAAIRL